MIGSKNLSTVLRLAVLLFLVAPAGSRAWEFAYGPPKTLDQGARRVAPVAWCPGGGYVAVGTQDLGGADPDVYVVRTDDSGATENDWQGSGDGRDLYLAHYDPNAAACHQEWSPQSRRTRAAVRHLPKRIHPRVSPSPLPAPAAPRLDPHPICP